ncbi:TRAP transporter substrate-binding protein [Ensifer sp. NM-2]|uniref:TRAP transporter substrate-binding protein n=1 Tax=Ensifer sp. NM-2 TaxID=2109730 RepID=UPI00130506BC|nr:TRAP transporter substrate-binding protein [Ensifer sp. NM-2]
MKILLKTMAAVALGMLATSAAQAQVTELRLAHMNGPQHSVNLGALKFKEAVEARTNGRVQVGVFPSGQLGESTAVGEQISLGGALIGQLSTGVLSDYVPDYSVLVYPFLFKDFGQIKAFLASDMPKLWAEELEKSNLKVLCHINFGTRDLYTRDKAVRVPTDMTGLKFRVQPATMYTELAKSMGATPTPMPWPEIYSALAQGVIDAAEAPPNAIVDQKHYEHAKMYMKTNHIVDVSPIVMSLSAFNGLSKEEQAVVAEESQKACDWISEDTAKAYDASVQVLKDKGMTIVEDVDRAAFAKGAEGIEKAFPKWTPNLVSKVRAALANQ